jgi:hypothetical protein
MDLNGKVAEARAALEKQLPRLLPLLARMLQFPI